METCGEATAEVSTLIARTWSGRGGPRPSHGPWGTRGDWKCNGLKQRTEMQPHLRGGGAARRCPWGTAQK